jgi:hypothetical protein
LAANAITVVYALKDDASQQFSFDMSAKNGRSNVNTKLHPSQHRIDCMATGTVFKPAFIVTFN